MKKFLCYAYSYGIQYDPKMVRTVEEPKEKIVTIRFTKKEYEAIMEQAKKDHRGLSNFIRWVVMKTVERS